MGIPFGQMRIKKKKKKELHEMGSGGLYDVEAMSSFNIGLKETIRKRAARMKI